MGHHRQPGLGVEALHAGGENVLLCSPGLHSKVVSLDVPPGVIVDILDGNSVRQILLNGQYCVLKRIYKNILKALHTAGDLVSHVGERVIVIKGPVIIPPSEVVSDHVPGALLDPPRP